MENKKLNWFQRQYHKLSRYIQRMVLSAQLDNNSIDFDIDKLPNDMKDVVGIVKKVLSHDVTKVYHNKNKQHNNREYIITDDVYEISLTNVGFQYELLRLKHKEDVISIVIPNKVLVYLHWLIERRLEINFKKYKDEINIANDKQIKKFAELLNK